MKIKILFMKIVLPFFLFLTYETLQSQTVIKERVILKPNLSNQNFQNDQTEMEWGFIPGCATNRSKCAGFSYYQSESVNNFYRMKINSGNAQFARCYSDGVDLYGNSLVVSGYYLTLVNSFDVIFSGMNIGLDTAYIGISVESITQNELVIFEVRNYSICILPNNFYVSTEDSLAVLTTGEIISSIAEIKPGSHADDGAIPPEELKLNLDIIKGASLGDIEVPERNFLGKSICDVDHDEGRLKFNFVANGNISKDVDTAIVRVSSSFKNMEDPKFQDFIFVVYKYNPIELIFSKPTINTWDSTNITIKKRDISGEFIDFPADQLFNIKIIDGTDFSILYSGTRGWYSTNFNDVSQEDLKLYSFETINDITKINIYVETFVDDGIIISSIREKNVEPNLKKILSNTKINAKLKLYGFGEISIVRSGARLNVSFAKNPISPGEQTKINIEGIDDWGNPITFPPEQTFYLYIWNGNQYGELYSASTGQSGEAIVDAPEEFFFNAADSIDADTAYAEIYVETEYDAGGGVYKIASDNNRKRIKSSSEIMKIYTELKQNKTKEIEDKSRNKITALAGFQSASEVQLLSGMGELMISEGGDCSDAPQCEELIYPEINFVQIDTSLCDYYKDADGVTNFYTEKFVDEFGLNACYNQNQDKWQFQIKNPLKYSSEVCYKSDKVYLSDTNQIKTIAYDELCRAQIDFILFENSRKTKYKIVEIIRRHENLHVEQNVIILNQAIGTTGFYNFISSLYLSCNERKNQKLAEEYALNKIKPTFVRRLIQEYLKIKRLIAGNPYSDNVQEIQKWVDNEAYINEDIKIRNLSSLYYDIANRLNNCLN